jgi:hypothetical protein
MFCVFAFCLRGLWYPMHLARDCSLAGVVGVMTPPRSSREGWLTIADFEFSVVPLFGSRLAIVRPPGWTRGMRVLAASICLGAPITYELDQPAHRAVSAVLCALSIVLWALTIFTDPGILPPAAAHDLKSNEDHRHSSLLADDGYQQDAGLHYCRTCHHFRPRRASHCRLCKVCLLEHDHHCGVLGCCVAARNLRWFVLYLAVTTAASLYGSLILLDQLVAGLERQQLSASHALPGAVALTLGLCAASVLGVFSLRVVYVISAGGSTRHGALLPSSDGHPDSSESAVGLAGLALRWRRVILPRVPTLLPAYADSLAAVAFGRVDVAISHDDQPVMSRWGVVEEVSSPLGRTALPSESGSSFVHVSADL